MKYIIKNSAAAGDVIPLGLVADAMALRDATAGGPDFLSATRDGRFKTYSAMLLKNVHCGALAVCGDDGDPGRPDEIVESRTAGGAGVVLLQGRLDDEPGVVDVDATLLCNVFVKLKVLNDWAAQRGDEFTVSHEGVRWVEASHHVEQVGKHVISHFEVRTLGMTAQTELPPVVVAGPTLLATRVQLIDAFGAFTGMDQTWFDNVTDAPALHAARKLVGVGQKSQTVEPLFCPMEVVRWLLSPKRKKGRKFHNPEKPWELLQKHFPAVYAKNSAADPRA